MPNVFVVTYTIEDAKGQRAKFSVNFPESTKNYMPVLDDFVVTTAALIDSLIKGKVVGASVTYTYNLPRAGLKATPNPDADIEERALFIFRLAGMIGDSTILLPTFDEAFMIPGVGWVDGTDPAVDAFAQRIVQGRTLGIINVSPSDDRGVDLDMFLGGREKFRRSRR